MPEETQKQSSQARQKARRDWYSLSLDTVRAWGIVIGILGLLVIGVAVYDFMQGLSAERQAERLAPSFRPFFSVIARRTPSEAGES